MGMIDDSEDGLTFRADHDQNLHAIDAGVLGAWGIDLHLTMGTFHVGTSDLAAPTLARTIDKYYLIHHTSNHPTEHRSQPVDPMVCPFA